jgi:hypothetical protein
MRTITFGITHLAASALGACAGDDGHDPACQGAACGGGGAGATSLQDLVVQPAACTADADCCVVYELCQAQAYVVLATDYERAQTWAAEAPQESCVRCIPPSVEVRCVDGGCAGFELPYDDPSYEVSRTDHCGIPALEQSAGADAAGAGAGGDRVLGCGN